VSFRSYLPNTNSHRRVSLGEIDTVVSERLGSTRGLGKSQPACFNRQIAMYLASHIGRWSTTAIGRFYGGRDHSTVVHAMQRVARLRVADLRMEALLSEFERSLSGTKEQGTRGTVPSPIGSRQVALRVYQRLEPGTPDPRPAEQLMGSGSERIICSEG